MLALRPWRALVHFNEEAGQALSHRCFATRLVQCERVGRCWQISSHGRCRNSHGIISNGHLSPSGYHKVMLQGYCFYVHRLVALAFLGSPDPVAWQVHHTDSNRSNNHVDNLEYVTPAQNVSLSYSSPARGNPGRRLSMPVMWRAVGSQYWQTSPSMVAAAMETGVSTSSVSRSCKCNISVMGLEFCFAKLAEDDEVEGEVWKQMLDPKTGSVVPGRMVSSFGRVQMQNGRKSSGYQVKQGYAYTPLNSRIESIHRLVAFAFWGPPPTGQHIQVNHRDHDRSNNSVGNLEYVTPSENVSHSYRSETKRQLTSNVKPVESRPNIGSGEWTWHLSIADAARVCGVSRALVRFHAQNNRSHAGKFEFRFAQVESSKDRPGEEWRDVDVAAHLQERSLRR